ncbi:NB-ARC domain-containing protein [Crossiella sp. SN42]|uniref:AfsR/SARP family transcriptional regulator n=1 Tax=Crossiella sp. SN42 TaxID=2944808 RepID=UPI00207C1858|nr:BTAD domain-containing putative transcriptional regulator [Crossiella sp. SN42]MCO1574350.1 NB-ARC domain-containing protein [Crossiella sp. SN42]
MRFGVLGEIEAWTDQAVVLGHARQRSVLAVLLVEANRVVSADQLIDRVWDEHAPQRVRGVLSTYISRLRSALRSADGVGLTRSGSGYLLTTEADSVDLHRFRSLLCQARQAGDDERAVGLFDQAIGMWRGQPLTGLDTRWADEVRAGLLAERLAAELDRGDAMLRCGRHAQLLAGLTELAAAHPLDERLAEQLMLALYRCGRAGDALAHYRSLHRRLAEELGVDPRARLQQLHQRILAADPDLEPQHQGPVAPSRPRQLPAPPRRFIAREAELARLDQAVHDRGDWVVITGAGGVGKTWLALEWANRNLGRFPDGQLYANLRGFHPTGVPADAATVLAGLLHTLGVEPAGVPVDLDARAALYRSLVAGRRLLVLLDDARDTEQVLPLLPGERACTVLVTSRHRLSGLVTQHEAHPVTVDVLADDAARELLLAQLGADRLAAEPEAVTELLRCCEGLPLALSIVTARARARPELALATLAKELHDAHGRLDALDTEELTASLRAVFTASVQALTAAAAELFGLLSLVPGPDIDPLAASALTAGSPGLAHRALRALEAAHLVHRDSGDRYRMHDLLRCYAAEHLARNTSEHTREQAAQRLLDYYRHGCALALGEPAHVTTRREPPPAGAHRPAHLPSLDTRAQALAWLKAEHANLFAAVAVAADRGWHDRTWALGHLLQGYLFLRGHADEVRTAQRLALDAAHHVPHTWEQAGAVLSLGRAHWHEADYPEAVRCFERARELAQRTAEQPMVAAATVYLSAANAHWGRWRTAARQAGQAVLLAVQAADRGLELLARTSLANVTSWLGEHDPARSQAERALALATGAAEEYFARLALAAVWERLGQHQRTHEQLHRLLGLERELHWGWGVHAVHAGLANALVQLGRPDEARHHLGQAIPTGTADPWHDCLAQLRAGAAHHGLAQHDLALEQYEHAMTFAVRIDNPGLRGEIHQRLAEHHEARGEHRLATEHQQRARSLATRARSS